MNDTQKLIALGTITTFVSAIGVRLYKDHKRKKAEVKQLIEDNKAFQAKCKKDVEDIFGEEAAKEIFG